MKIYFALFLLAAMQTVYSQNGLTNFDDSRQFFIGVDGSPDYCYRTSPYYSKYVNIVEPKLGPNFVPEKPKLGYTVGIDAAYKVTRIFAVMLGFEYSNKGYLSGSFGLFSNTSGNLTFVPIKEVLNYEYCDVPLKAYFTAGRRKVRFIAGVGLTLNILVKEINHESAIYNGVTTPYSFTIDAKRIDLSPSITAGVEYRLNSRIYLRVAPIFNYGILKVTDNNSSLIGFAPPVAYYLWNAGLKVSCLFSTAKKQSNQE